MSETAAGVARVHDVVADVMATHAARGSRLQTWLRVAVVVFVWATLVIVPPVGLVGKLRSKTLLCGVIAFSMAPAVTTKPFSALQATGTATP